MKIEYEMRSDLIRMVSLLAVPLMGSFPLMAQSHVLGCVTTGQLGSQQIEIFQKAAVNSETSIPPDDGENWRGDDDIIWPPGVINPVLGGFYNPPRPIYSRTSPIIDVIKEIDSEIHDLKAEALKEDSYQRDEKIYLRHERNRYSMASYESRYTLSKYRRELLDLNRILFFPDKTLNAQRSREKLSEQAYDLIHPSAETTMRQARKVNETNIKSEQRRRLQALLLAFVEIRKRRDSGAMETELWWNERVLKEANASPAKRDLILQEMRHKFPEGLEVEQYSRLRSLIILSQLSTLVRPGISRGPSSVSENFILKEFDFELHSWYSGSGVFRSIWDRNGKLVEEVPNFAYTSRRLLYDSPPRAFELISSPGFKEFSDALNRGVVSQGLEQVIDPKTRSVTDENWNVTLSEDGTDYTYSLKMNEVDQKVYEFIFNLPAESGSVFDFLQDR